MAAPVLQEMATLPRRYRFTSEQFYRLGETGILGEDERVELIEGEIIEMAAIGPTHAWLLSNLLHAVMSQIGPDIRVDVQSPIHLGRRSEPQPDLCLSRRHAGRIAHPTPEDIYFVVEVSDTTLEYDRDTKLPLYAAAGIPESWLFDAQARILERHTDPQDGIYRQILRAGRRQSLASTTLPAVTIAVDDLLR
jgi:Uma2 family endonuclease